MAHHVFFRRLAAIGTSAAMLSGCAGLPGWNVSSSNSALTKNLVTTGTLALPERYDAAGKVPTTQGAITAWWEGFGDPALMQVVTQTLMNNSDIAIAHARVAQAQAVLAGTHAAGRPRMELGAGATGSRSSLGDPSRAGQPGPIDRNTTSVQAGSTLTWEWDVFGRQTQALSASQQRLLSRQAALAATQLMVASEAARIVIEIRTLQQQRGLAAETHGIDREAGDVATVRFNAGLEPQLDTLRAQALLRGSAAEVQRLIAALADAQRALAILASVTPSQIDDWLRTGAALTLGEVPVWQMPNMPPAGVPSDLLRRRPDVLQAQADLQAASADLAAVMAERWPRFNLAATLGWVAASVASLGKASALAASLAPSINWTAWDSGALNARIDQQSAQQREALARYQQLVMQAFAEAETAMKQREQYRAEVAERVQATQAAAQTQKLAQSQFNGGLTDWVKTVDARRTRIAALSAEVLARQQQALAQVALYRAMGGSWP